MSFKWNCQLELGLYLNQLPLLAHSVRGSVLLKVIKLLFRHFEWYTHSYFQHFLNPLQKQEQKQKQDLMLLTSKFVKVYQSSFQWSISKMLRWLYLCLHGPITMLSLIFTVLCLARIFLVFLVCVNLRRHHTFSSLKFSVK